MKCHVNIIWKIKILRLTYFHPKCQLVIRKWQKLDYYDDDQSHYIKENQYIQIWSKQNLVYNCELYKLTWKQTFWPDWSGFHIFTVLSVPQEKYKFPFVGLQQTPLTMLLCPTTFHIVSRLDKSHILNSN